MYSVEIIQMADQQEEIISSMKIQSMVRDMDTSMRKHKKLKTSNFAEYRKKLSEENEVLYNRFPTIFEMHIQGKLDQTFFEMLKLRRQIEKKEITEDDASKLIGQKLFDRFVGPIVNNTPPPEKPLSYSEFYKNFDNKE
jgi:hypothetical protein